MEEIEIRNKFVGFISSIKENYVDTDESLSILKENNPNEWAVFSEGELGVQAENTCAYCGISLPKLYGSSVCSDCEGAFED